MLSIVMLSAIKVFNTPRPSELFFFYLNIIVQVL
jgi:hypothetical protein